MTARYTAILVREDHADDVARYVHTLELEAVDRDADPGHESDDESAETRVSSDPHRP